MSGSSHPLSIVIVGVGDADFSAMNVLDADDVPLVHRGRRMSRDIVQFVAFRDFEGGRNGAMLARETLREIPGQLVSYFLSRGIRPSLDRFEGVTFPQPSELEVSQTASWSATTTSYVTTNDGVQLPAFHAVVLGVYAQARKLGLLGSLAVLAVLAYLFVRACRQAWFR